MPLVCFGGKTCAKQVIVNGVSVLYAAGSHLKFKVEELCRSMQRTKWRRGMLAQL